MAEGEAGGGTDRPAGRGTGAPAEAAARGVGAVIAGRPHEAGASRAAGPCESSVRAPRASARSLAYECIRARCGRRVWDNGAKPTAGVGARRAVGSSACCAPQAPLDAPVARPAASPAAPARERRHAARRGTAPLGAAHHGGASMSSMEDAGVCAAAASRTCASTTSAVGAGLSLATAGVPSIFTILARDGNFSAVVNSPRVISRRLEPCAGVERRAAVSPAHVHCSSVPATVPGQPRRMHSGRRH